MTTITIRQRKICQKVTLNLSLEKAIKLWTKTSMSRQRKKCKLELKGVLAGMPKVVNKPLHNGENFNADLSILITDLLCQGTSKALRDELVEKYPTPGNC